MLTYLLRETPTVRVHSKAAPGTGIVSPYIFLHQNSQTYWILKGFYIVGVSDSIGEIAVSRDLLGHTILHHRYLHKLCIGEDNIMDLHINKSSLSDFV